MKLIISTVLLSAVVALCQAVCETTTLQENIDYERLDGKWHQKRYTTDTQYEELHCFGVQIKNINMEAKNFQMVTYFTPYPEIKKGMAPDRAFITFDTYASFAERVEGQEFIGDHIASDYDNYLIFYQCDSEGNAVVDIEVRGGVSLSGEKIEEIDDHLKKIGSSYESLSEEDSTKCPTFIK